MDVYFNVYVNCLSSNPLSTSTVALLGLITNKLTNPNCRSSQTGSSSPLVKMWGCRRFTIFRPILMSPSPFFSQRMHEECVAIYMSHIWTIAVAEHMFCFTMTCSWCFLLPANHHHELIIFPEKQSLPVALCSEWAVWSFEIFGKTANPLQFRNN